MARTSIRDGALKLKPSSRSSAVPKAKKLPGAGKSKAPVRLPQRSEAISGDESKAPTPIAAAQKKKLNPNRPRPGRREI